MRLWCIHSTTVLAALPRRIAFCFTRTFYIYVYAVTKLGRGSRKAILKLMSACAELLCTTVLRNALALSVPWHMVNPFLLLAVYVCWIFEIRGVGAVSLSPGSNQAY